MQRNIIKLLFVTILVGFWSCKTTQTLPTIVTSVEILQADVKYLASDELEGRETGTEGERKAAEYISKRFADMGLKGIFEGENAYYQFFKKTKRANPHATEPSPDDVTVNGRNVGAFLDNNSEHTIIIGAHYDHLGYGAEGSLYVGPPAIHNGADDNASGIASMLALAKFFKTVPLKNNILFLAFSGEEKGLWGSNFFVDNSPIEHEDINFMINMDMVGRLNPDRQLPLYGTRTAPEWNDIIYSIKKPYFKYTIEESGVGPSDHTSFYLEDMPVLHFFTGQHEDYHRPTDDYEKVNFAGMNDIVHYIAKVVLKADAKGKFKFTKTDDASQVTPDFKVTLGVIPDYLFDGRGMRIDGVRENRPASNAGIKKGDIVVKMGDIEVVDMMSYMKALGAFNPGETVKVVIEREGKMITKDVTF